MTVEEIIELMNLRGWTQRDLARELDIHETAVCKWIKSRQAPGGPAKILMRQWLEESREEERVMAERRKKARMANTRA